MNPQYAPPKDIGSALRSMFDYQDEKVFDGITGLERSYDGWQHMMICLKGWIAADEQNFLNYIKNAEVDPEVFLDYQDPFKVQVSVESVEPRMKYFVDLIKGKPIVIHTPTQEEWDRIVKLFGYTDTNNWCFFKEKSVITCEQEGYSMLGLYLEHPYYKVIQSKDVFK